MLDLFVQTFRIWHGENYISDIVVINQPSAFSVLCVIV